MDVIYNHIGLIGCKKQNVFS